MCRNSASIIINEKLFQWLGIACLLRMWAELRHTLFQLLFSRIWFPLVLSSLYWRINHIGFQCNNRKHYSRRRYFSSLKEIFRVSRDHELHSVALVKQLSLKSLHRWINSTILKISSERPPDGIGKQQHPRILLWCTFPQWRKANSACNLCKLGLRALCIELGIDLLHFHLISNVPVLPRLLFATGKLDKMCLC